MTPFVSVIIPIFNSEKWLERCIDSALKQTLVEIEIILVNDGSTDGSGALCDRYSQGDERVKTYHKPNGGVSAARQFGLEHATGDFIIYLDSDDFVEPTMYEELYRTALRDSSDIVTCDWISIEGENQYLDKYRIRKWSANTLAKALIYDHPTYLPIVLIRRSLFQRFNIAFPSNRVSYGEDTLVLIELLTRSIEEGDPVKVSYVSKHMYYYDKTANCSSLMKLSPAKMNLSQLRVFEYLQNNLNMKRFGREFYSRLSSYSFSAIWNDIYPFEDYLKLYTPHREGIKKYARKNAKRNLSLIALAGNYDRARRLLWLAYPYIIEDKINALIRKKL